ncbi:spore gernimation protein GerA [Salipaludibacillus neizhouensis]|uniref:Spore gernimation protein GerA n=1 Tax=Salipaludibacillus neizhouensis TaxID=885475 RepID=A0A3A9K4I1_9BACI|nr:spore germination protein [Salipaludibacillus neizhouensis]RKL66238.1 spore gernimation protein GerA [Salipaludibacillus neizhouensis]
MDEFLIKIKNKFRNNDDLFLQEEQILDVSVIFIGFNTLIDLTKTKRTLHKHIANAISSKKTIGELLNELGEVKEEDMTEAISSIMKGKLLIVIKDQHKYVILEPVPKLLSRAIEKPTNENVLQGPLSSFNEDIETNIGLIRKQINSSKIRAEFFSVGPEQKTKLSLLYFDGQVDKKLVEKVKLLLEKNQDRELNNLQDLTEVLGFSGWSVITKFNVTELPSETVPYLRKGRIVLLVDRFPFALIIPCFLWDMFTLENDRNFPIPLMTSIRTVRVIGILITLFLPALYVALVAVNPEVLRLELALTIAQSREAIPYPALVEIILMLIIMELIIEATVRLPSTIGPTITMVGGIILGQAVVEAKLVSTLLIIILAATTIANSTLVGIQNFLAVRFLKYLMVILASIYGVLGILGGMVLISAYLASIETFGISYLHLNYEKEGTKYG